MDDFTSKIKPLVVKDTIVIVSGADMTEEEMTALAKNLRRAGAIDVIFNEDGVELQTLSDKELAAVGLCRLHKLERESLNGKGSKARNGRKIQGTH